MQVTTTEIEGVRLIVTRRFEDERGFFSEVFSEVTFPKAGIDFLPVQDNHVLSRLPYTLRGIHYQLPPFAQSKLVRVVRGAALDVVVDLRRGSPTFARFFTATLTAENWTQVLVPPGCGHATLSLAPDTEFIYKVTAPYSPAHERGVRFDDPQFSIPWGVDPARFTISERDRALPLLRHQPDLPSQ